MSTRCNVVVESSEGGPPEYKDKVQLYHHCDGYPDGIMPLLADAFRKAIKHVHENQERLFPDDEAESSDFWELGRSGKVAGVICATDLLEFEPESLGCDCPHGDIEYLYTVSVHTEGLPRDQWVEWIIEVDPIYGDDERLTYVWSYGKTGYDWGETPPKWTKQSD